MLGYIFNLKKFTSINDAYVENQRNTNDFIVFGEFDRLSVQKIVSFNRYRDVPKAEKRWVGKRQEILLYNIVDEPKVQYKLETHENGVSAYFGVQGVDQDDLREKRYRFMTTSMLSLSREVLQNYGEFRQLKDIASKEIRNFIDHTITLSSFEDIQYEIYGTFNSSEVCILWLSDQYTQVLKIMDRLKRLTFKRGGEKYPLFLTVFSVIAFNYPSLEGRIEGKAILQMVLKNTTQSHEEIKKYLAAALNIKEIERSLYCAGQIDFQYIGNADDIIKLFLAGNAFDKYDEMFQLHIEETNVRLAYIEEETPKSKFETKLLSNVLRDISDDSWLSRNEVSAPFHLADHIMERNDLSLNHSVSDEVERKKDGQNIYHKYQEIRDKLKLIFPAKTAGTIDTLDLLYSDYLSNIAFEHNQVRANDFTYQFSSVLEVLNDLLDLFPMEDEAEDLYNTEEKSKFLMDYQQLTDDFKQQIIHLGQSSKYFLQIPICHQHFTGHVDQILYAYYGIAKEIIETAYQLKRTDMQSELIPLITVDTVPIVNSKLYIDLEEVSRKRIIVIQLPGNIMFDLPRGYCYLIHELFHYVVPKRRSDRNQFFGFITYCICFEALLIENMLQYMKYTISEPSYGSADDIIRTKIKMFYAEHRQQFYHALAEDYEGIHKSITQAISNKLRSKKLDPSGASLWNNYYEYLFEALPNMYHRFICTDRLERLLKTIKKDHGDFLVEKLFNGADRDLPNAAFLKDIKNALYKVLEELCQGEKNTHKIFQFTDRGVISAELWEKIRNALSAMMETCVDIPMVSMLEMHFVDYLFFFAQSLMNTGSFKLSFADMYRIGMVASYFNVIEGKDLGVYEEEFKRMCYGIYTKLDTDDGKEDGFAARIAEKWMALFSEAIQRYHKDLGQYENIINYIIEEADVNQRKLPSYSIPPYPRTIMGRYRNILSETGKKLLSIKDNGKEKIEEPNLNQKRGEVIQAQADKLFRLNLDIIFEYQKQKSFHQLDYTTKPTMENREEKYKLSVPIENNPISEGCQRYTWEYTVGNLGELTNCLKSITDDLLPKKEHRGGQLINALWYRGETNSENQLIPSIMRVYRDNIAENNKRYGSLAKLQRDYFERFKFRADGAPEMQIKANYTMSDYIGLMQHYSVPTNFLDWSEDAFTALYFALENEINFRAKESGGAEKYTDEEKDVSLYIFQPIFYNTVRNQILKTIDTQLDVKILEQYKNATAIYGSYLPNLSLKDNEIIFPMFLMGTVFDDLMLPATKNCCLENNLGKASLPMAVLTSRLNDRIRAQSGNFLAFSLYSPMDIEEGQATFDYLSLEKVQEYFLKHMNEYDLIDKMKSPFLYKINIRSHAKEEIAGWLTSLGVSKERIYPELNNVGLRVKDKI